MMVRQVDGELPQKPNVRPGNLIYQAPAPVRITVNDKTALMGENDTVTITFDTDRPIGMSIQFDWDVQEESLPTRYRTNESLGGQVDVWYERAT
jgi:hypothetical protein